MEEFYRDDAKSAKEATKPLRSISSFVFYIAYSLRIANVLNLVFLAKNLGRDLRNIKISNAQCGSHYVMSFWGDSVIA